MKHLWVENIFRQNEDLFRRDENEAFCFIHSVDCFGMNQDQNKTKPKKKKIIIAENENNSVLYAAEQWHIGAC